MTNKEILNLHEGAKFEWTGENPDKHVVRKIFYGNSPYDIEDMEIRADSEIYGTILIEASELLNEQYKI